MTGPDWCTPEGPDPGRGQRAKRKTNRTASNPKENTHKCLPVTPTLNSILHYNSVVVVVAHVLATVVEVPVPVLVPVLVPVPVLVQDT